MMYFERKVDAYLREWRKDEFRKPLIISGARQIGKTESIRHFAREAYGNVIEINFVHNHKFRNLVEDGYTAESIVKRMSVIDTTLKFTPHDTLIFFDEITEYPEIATSLKFFREDGRFDVICSGSMLGLNYRRIEHNSVGNKTDYFMRSMDFEEFLWTRGYGKDTVDSMLSHMISHTPFSELEMSVYLELFLDYAILGGMPDVVRRHVARKTFEGTLALQEQLVRDYCEDMRKYADGLDQTRILNVFNRVTPQLAQENKKFQISKVAPGAKFRDYRGCTEWLKDAGIVNICHCMNFPELPIRGNVDVDKFKLYFADTGLLVSQLDPDSAADLRANKNLGVYKGALYENIVGEALVKAGFDLCYYKREDSSLEMDFFVRNRDSLIPVEVKATNGRSKSLRTLIDSDRYPDIRFGIKLSANNIGIQSGIRTFPYFCAFLLKRYLAESN